MKTRLALPSARWKESYLALVAEFREAGELFVPFTIGFPADDFGALLRRLDDCSKGIGLSPGHVPHTTFWLVSEDEEVVAVSNLRHHLTDTLRRRGGNIGYGVRPSARRRGHATAILAATLVEAGKLGLDRCLVTCSKENRASATTIIRNGGALDSEEYLEDWDETIQRYWIATPAPDPRSSEPAS